VVGVVEACRHGDDLSVASNQGLVDGQVWEAPQGQCGRPGFEAVHHEEAAAAIEDLPTTLRGRHVVDHAWEEVEGEVVSIDRQRHGDEHHPTDPFPLFLIFMLRGVIVEVTGDIGRVEGAEAAEEGGIHDNATPLLANCRSTDEGDLRVDPLEDEAKDVIVQVAPCCPLQSSNSFHH
jgi:hypothetical protein